jgi:hypothetical protein
MKTINLLKYIFQVINYSVLALAIGLYTASVYIWSKTDSINSLILILVAMGFFVTLSTIFSICMTGNSPCAYLLSKILYCAKLFITFVVGILLIIDQEMFVQFMNENMEDSKISIDELQRDLNKHFRTVTILYIIYITLMVNLS